MINNKKNNSKKPILLCILDGWGIGDNSSPNNAIARAKTPNYDQILANYPHCKLGTSGLEVGLPEGQIGNSEVGHTCIGSGRVIFQDLPRINMSIKDGSLAENSNLKNLIAGCKKSGSVCHLVGLLSDGGVHCHQNHIIALAKIVAGNGVEVKLHAFLDGRDVAQKSAITYIEHFINETKNFPQISIASIGGRYYAMDRDKNWNRVKLAYDAIVSASGPKDNDPISVVQKSYEKNITDEFIIPSVIGNYTGIKDGDALLVANFRADRIRQISTALLDSEFNEFETKKINFSSQVSTTEYSANLNQFFAVLFPTIDIKNSLGEILENHNLTQLRIAETEKYAHVTFFFSGGREEEFRGENRILIKSPSVATYDLQPQMSSKEVGKNLIEAIVSDSYDFIVVNYANADMVGHSGIFSAAVAAVEAIDLELGMLRDAILKQDGIMLITADHGNIEDMMDHHHNPHTAHTTNPVPFILIGNNVANIKLSDGKLSDIAPTILSLINLSKPSEMTGKNLIL